MKKIDVLIVGAGLSGLTAAKLLKAAGKSVKVIEASDDIGGRVRTDFIGGFLLDRGFQVLLTEYPEAKKILNYRALNLRYFDSGAYIFNENGVTTIADPTRKPARLWQTLFSSVGSLKDKLLMLKLKRELKHKTESEIFRGLPLSTLEFLQNYGFSKQMIANFFKPFFGGVFLENELGTQADMFEFLFKMFSEGNAAIPALGMGMIAKQLGDVLEPHELLLNKHVVSISEGTVRTGNSQSYDAEYILLTADDSLLKCATKGQPVDWRPVSNIYFIADKAPSLTRMVMLNASKNKLVNNMVIINNISPYYAPVGKSLISVSLLGNYLTRSPHILATQVIEELAYWFNDARDWRYFRIYHIPSALPDKIIVKSDLMPKEIRLSERIFRCGDYLMNGSINAAIKSGRLAAEAILSL